MLETGHIEDSTATEILSVIFAEVPDTMIVIKPRRSSKSAGMKQGAGIKRLDLSCFENFGKRSSTRIFDIGLLASAATR